ncbi:MAG: tRNA lysidine(34) synthetase TilS [Terriglobia bacterium]
MALPRLTIETRNADGALFEAIKNVTIRGVDAPTMARAPNLYHRWSLEMRRPAMFPAGERVGVAVSGGPDSVLLLCFMSQFAVENGLCLSVVHFNHHLRGGESNEDERFVAARAGELKLDFYHAGADVARAARETKKSLEVAARELRYRFFFSLIRQGKTDKIATAHTASDQAETVLLRLLRGAGTRGLSGIFPVLEGRVVRPFLGITRTEVEREIERRSLAFRIDRSNSDLRFARNKIRHSLLPLLEREFNPEIVSILKQFADRARDDEAFLEQQAADIARPWRVREGLEERIPARPFAQFPAALQRRVLRQMIASCGGLPRSTASHIELVRRFSATAQSGKTLTLPVGVEAHKEFGWLVIRRKSEEPQPADFSFPLSPPAELAIPAIPGGLLKVYYETAENAGRKQLERTYNGTEGVCLDAEKYQGPLVLRNWRPGDCFCPLGSSKPRKLKELFATLKIARNRRRLWPVIESAAGIIWVRGFPPASRLALSPATERILVIEEITGRVGPESE